MPHQSAPVLSFTPSGIYCAAGDFYIDPARPVPRALITHGHSDHARPGHGAYLCTAAAAPVIAHRLGVSPETIRYGETRQIGAARVAFYPAGHVPGSAQIRVEVAGEVWVVSGDYKLEPDGVCEPFAPVRCHAFISECTFGLPLFHWEPQARVLDQINRWWAAGRAEGRASVITAYALGKAQRILAHLDPGTGPIILSASIAATTDILRAQGLRFPATITAGTGFDARAHPGALVLATPSGKAGWLDGFGEWESGFASGWMTLGRQRQARSARMQPERTQTGGGFVLSDHADWAGLNRAIRETGAAQVFVTHGYTAPFCRWLASQGYDARVVPDRSARAARPATALPG